MHNQRAITVLITILIVCTCTVLSPITCSNQTTTSAQATTPTNPLPTAAWNATFGLPRYNQAHQIIQTKDGGYAVTGMYGGSIRLNATLVKYDSNGNLLWHQIYDLQFINYPINTGLLQTNDSGYAILGNSQNIVLTLIKTGANGETQWNQTYPGHYLAWGMTQTSDGGYLITGATSISSIEGNAQAVLIKTNASGKIEWNKTFGMGYFHAVVQADDGSYVAAGGLRLMKVNASGGIVWDKELPSVRENDQQQYRFSGSDIYALIKTSDGGYALAGHAVNSSRNFSTSAAILIKTDSAGNILWNRTYGVDKQTWAFSIVQTIDNGYALAGMAHTLPNPEINHFKQTDMVLIKTDMNGNEQWTQSFGNSEDTEIAYSVVATADGGFAMAGRTNIGDVFKKDYYYIVKTTSVLPTASPTLPQSVNSPMPSIETLAAIVAILTAIICSAVFALVKKKRAYQSKRGI